MLLRAIGLWRIQIIATVVTLAGSVSLAFCTEFWHVIVCYGLLQGRLVTDIDVSQFEYTNLVLFRLCTNAQSVKAFCEDGSSWNRCKAGVDNKHHKFHIHSFIFKWIALFLNWVLGRVRWLHHQTISILIYFKRFLCCPCIFSTSNVERHIRTLDSPYHKLNQVYVSSTIDDVTSV